MDPFAAPPLDPMMPPLGGGMPPPPMGMPPLPEPLPPVQYGPTPRPWFKKPPKPKLAEVLAAADRQQEDHETWLGQVRFMADVLAQEIQAIFPRDREKVEAGEIEPMPLSDIRDEHEGYCSRIAGMQVGIAAKASETFDREESAAKEDFCYALLERWQEHEIAAEHGPVGRGIVEALGRVGKYAAFIRPDFTDEDFGIELRAVDPTTVFSIVEGRRGLAAVYRAYEALAGDVIGDHGDDTGTVEAKVKKIAKGDNGRYDHAFKAEVVEYWDRHWALIAYDGVLIRTWEHAYGVVPFIVTPGCFGLPGFLATPDTDKPLERADILRGTALSSHLGRDIARRCEPFLWRRMRSHMLEEAVGSHLLTALRRSINPPIVVKQGVMSAQEGLPEANNQEGGLTGIRDDDAIEPFPNLPDPSALTPLMVMLGQNRQTGMAPGVLMGQNPAAQTSGSAMDIMAQGGFENWNPLVFAVQAVYAAVFTRALEIVRDWGDLIGAPDDRGALYVPRRNPPLAPGRVSPVHKITPDLIRRTGVRLSVKLHKFNAHSLGTIGNGLAIAKSMGVLDKRTILNTLAITDDPEGVLARVERELLDEVPEIMQARNLNILKREGELALAQGDEESAQDTVLLMRFLAEQMQIALMQKMAMPGMAAAMGGGAAAGGGPVLGPNGMPLAEAQPGLPLDPATAAPPGTAPPPELVDVHGDSAVVAQGQSLPGFNMPPGTDGGRPALG